MRSDAVISHTEQRVTLNSTSYINGGYNNIGVAGNAVLVWSAVPMVSVVSVNNLLVTFMQSLNILNRNTRQ